MRRYRYLTITVAICRDYDTNDHMDVIVNNNPVSTLNNLIDNDGRAIIEIDIALGRRNIDNYMRPIASDNTKYRTCYVIKRFPLKLPKPMTREEIKNYVERITGVKIPVGRTSEKKLLVERLYEKLRGHSKLAEYTVF